MSSGYSRNSATEWIFAGRFDRGSLFVKPEEMEPSMARFRKALPQLGSDFFLTDGGIETTLLFLEGLELPHFAAFHLLKRPEGEAALRKYFRTYAMLAARFGTGLILESATWRASADWGTRLGYTEASLANANRQAVRLIEEIRDERRAGSKEVVISGCVGPRGDGYVPAHAMSEDDLGGVALRFKVIIGR